MARIAFPTETAESKERCLTSFSTTEEYLLRQFARDDNIATVHANILKIKQASLTATKYAQKLWRKTLRCGPVYNEKILKGVFVEGVHRSICRILR